MSDSVNDCAKLHGAVHQLCGRPSPQVPIWKDKPVCPCLNRLLKLRPVTLFKDLGVTQVLVLREEVSHIVDAFQAFLTGCQPDKSAPKIFKGELQNEYRNDSDYRPGCVPAWWRRLVLGTRARLTRPVLEQK